MAVCVVVWVWDTAEENLPLRIRVKPFRLVERVMRVLNVIWDCFEKE